MRSPLREFVAFVMGHSIAVAKCIRDIHALDNELEILKAEEDRDKFMLENNDIIEDLQQCLINEDGS
ncbi:hypothetical protein H0H87_011469 [Tephrocybe sp. NHM501043]|nr:hypothetical protein H0H87_011469 [Tephrocybe sp. NHM501043]